MLGIWLGSLAVAPHWTAIALAVGAGAIAQVIVEVTALVAKGHDARGDYTRMLNSAAFGGLAAGLAFMYVTAMLVKI